MVPTLTFYHGPRNIIEYYQAVLTIFGVLAGDDKHRSSKSRYRYFPVPLKLTDFTFPAAGIHLVQSHVGKVIR